jgi:HAD superfamily hydrolase (TIGR01509 family)
VLRAAFDEAEGRAAVDDEIATCGLDAMIQRHVDWQLAHLAALIAPASARRHDPGAGSQAGVPDLAALGRHLVDGFVTPVRAAAAANTRLLADLSARGFQLGVVSNACGNADVLCADLGYAPYLSVIVDSRRVGLYKPDPAIFIYAAAKLALRPSSVLMVGDSVDRDIRPAKTAGMMTAWLEGAAPPAFPDPSVIDLRLRAIAELPAALELRASA